MYPKHPPRGLLDVLMRWQNQNRKQTQMPKKEEKLRKFAFNIEP